MNKMKVEEYFDEWWTPIDSPDSGFNKTAMLDFAEMYHKKKSATDELQLLTTFAKSLTYSGVKIFTDVGAEEMARNFLRKQPKS